MNKSSLAVAQLWLGRPDFLEKKVQDYICDVFCSEYDVDAEATRRHIVQKKHHNIIWLSPETAQYKRADLELLFDRLRFKLDDGQTFFFILQHADCLNPSTGNSLLKSLEEPPAGYHFILCAQRKDLILPTIISRCIVHDYREQSSAQLDQNDSFFVLFTKKQALHHAWFDQCFADAKIDQYNSRLYLDQLLRYWHTKQEGAPCEQAQKCTTIITKQFKNLPMPGGTKIFWRNLFVQLQIHVFGM